jgi:integrase
MSRKPKHSKGLRQKDNGNWYLDIRIKGIRKRIDLGSQYLAEAEIQATIERENLKEKEDLIEDKDNGSLYQFFDRYEAWHVYPRKSPKTVAVERGVIKVIKEQYWTEDIPITDITIKMCEDLFMELSQRTTAIRDSSERKPVTPETLNLYLFTLRLLFKQAGIWKLIKETENPFLALKPYKESTKPPKILTEAEQLRLFTVLYDKLPRYADLFCFYLWTGLRRSEPLTLEWKDIDFEHSIMLVRGKGDKTRPVPIFLRTRWLLEARREKGLIRPFADAPLASSITAAFGKLSTWAGIDAKLHDLRKTCATELATKGVHKFFLKKWIGHVDDETTIASYIGFIDESTKARLDGEGFHKVSDMNELEKETIRKKEEEKLKHKRKLEADKRERNEEAIRQQKKRYREKHQKEINEKQNMSRKKAS